MEGIIWLSQLICWKYWTVLFCFKEHMLPLFEEFRIHSNYNQPLHFWIFFFMQLRYYYRTQGWNGIGCNIYFCNVAILFSPIIGIIGLTTKSTLYFDGCLQYTPMRILNLKWDQDWYRRRNWTPRKQANGNDTRREECL